VTRLKEYRGVDAGFIGAVLVVRSMPVSAL
jgi:hypothetical protein